MQVQPRELEHFDFTGCEEASHSRKWQEVTGSGKRKQTEMDFSERGRLSGTTTTQIQPHSLDAQTTTQHTANTLTLRH